MMSLPTKGGDFVVKKMSQNTLISGFFETLRQVSDQMKDIRLEFTAKTMKRCLFKKGEEKAADRIKASLSLPRVKVKSTSLPAIRWTRRLVKSSTRENVVHPKVEERTTAVSFDRGCVCRHSAAWEQAANVEQRNSE